MEIFFQIFEQSFWPVIKKVEPISKVQCIGMGPWAQHNVMVEAVIDNEIVPIHLFCICYIEKD